MAQLNDEEALAILNQLDWDDNEQFKLDPFEQQEDEADGIREGSEKSGDIDHSEAESEDFSLFAVMQEITRIRNEMELQASTSNIEDTHSTGAAASGAKISAKIALTDLQRWISQEQEDEHRQDDEKEAVDSALTPPHPLSTADSGLSAEPSSSILECASSAPAPAPAQAPVSLSQRDREIDRIIAEERILAELARCELDSALDKTLE
jgi:hypothetical protein